MSNNQNLQLHVDTVARHAAQAIRIHHKALVVAVFGDRREDPTNIAVGFLLPGTIGPAVVLVFAHAEGWLAMDPHDVAHLLTQGDLPSEDNNHYYLKRSASEPIVQVEKRLPLPSHQLDWLSDWSSTPN